MSKDKLPFTNFLIKMIELYPGILKIEENQLFCNYCCCRVNSQKKFNVQQHMITNKHKAAVSTGVIPPTKTITIKSAGTNSGKHFQRDLCRALIKSNIPINRIRNPSFKGFLQKYSTLRSKYIPQVYKETLNDIQEELCKKEADSDDSLEAPTAANNDDTFVEPALNNSVEFVKPAVNNNVEFVEPIAKKIRVGAKDPLNEPTLSTKQRINNCSTFRVDPLRDSHASSPKDDNLERALRKRKLLLEIEQLQIQNYEMKLKLWEKEQQLQMPSSRFTKEISARKRAAEEEIFENF